MRLIKIIPIAAIILMLLTVETVVGDVTLERPHAVLVVGTLHYSPELTMPLFAKELERFGFRTSVVVGTGDPEKKTENVLPGIEALADADLAIFFMRFLKCQIRNSCPLRATSSPESQ